MNDDAESKLAAPKLFGRKKAAGTTPPAAPAAQPEPTPEIAAEAVPPVAVPTEEPAAEPVDQPVAAPRVAPVAPVTPAAKPAEAPKPAKAAKPVTAPRPEKTPRAPRERPALPRLSGLQVAGIAGVVVGLFLVLATYGSLHLCATVRGADTCGGRAGFPLLLAIGIVAVVGGGTLLRLGSVRSPIGDSFLAVALVAVLTVLFLGDHYEAWWMLIAVPVLSLGAFLLAHWVSVTYIDPVDETE